MEFEFSQQQEWLDEIDARIIEERNQDIRHLESELEILSETFQDVALLVGQQAEPLELAAMNVEHAEISINEATTHIKAAEGLSVRSRKTAAIVFAASAAVATGGGLIAALASPVIGVVALSVGCLGAAAGAYSFFN